MTARRIGEGVHSRGYGAGETADVVYPHILAKQRRRRRLGSAANRHRRKRRIRATFGIKSLLAAFLVCSLPLGWFASRLHEERRQRDVAQLLTEAGGTVYFQHQREFDDDDSLSYNPKARWNPVEDEFFINIEIVNLADLSMDDDDLNILANLKGLRFLNLKNTPVSNAGINVLRRLPNLCAVNLEGTFVDRAGVERLAGALPNCSIRWVGGIVAGRNLNPHSPRVSNFDEHRANTR